MEDKSLRPLVFSGEASFKLAKDICIQLSTDEEKVTVGDLDIMTFADGEPWYKVINAENIVGRHVVLIQSTSSPVQNTYFDLWGIMNAIKQFNPSKLTIVMPFMGFRRQERDKEGGEALMAKMVAEFTVQAGATNVILCNPHAPVLVDFFIKAGANVKIIDGNDIFSSLMLSRDLSNHKVYTPDAGREDEASKLAEILGLGLLIGDKDRFAIDKSKSKGFNGDASDQKIIIREDEISTGGTLINSCQDLSQAGAVGAIILATHGVFAPGAIQKLKKMDFIKEIWITDSIYLPWKKRIDKIKVISIAEQVAKTIIEIHNS